MIQEQKKSKITRCSWVNLKNPLYIAYHDKEWGNPVHDDIKHFCMLTLEGAQAGLNWETILNKRENYIKSFAGFEPKKIAKFSEKKIAKLLNNPGIIRNKLKIRSTISNAQAYLRIQEEFGTFDDFIWSFVNFKPIINNFRSIKDCPTKTILSDKISKELKNRGFSFVGSTIIYSYMQAIGMADDHTLSCFRKKQQGWSLYMIRANNGSLYTGITKNIALRFKQHHDQNKHCAKYLRGKLPLTLSYIEFIGDHSDALKREYEIKKMPKLAKENFIKNNKI